MANSDLKKQGSYSIVSLSPALTTSSRVLRRVLTDSEIERKTRTAMRLQFCINVFRNSFDSLSLPGMYMAIVNINLSRENFNHQVYPTLKY